MFDSGAFVGEGLEELVCREADITSRLYNFDTDLSFNDSTIPKSACEIK